MKSLEDTSFTERFELAIEAIKNLEEEEEFKETAVYILEINYHLITKAKIDDNIKTVDSVAISYHAFNHVMENMHNEMERLGALAAFSLVPICCGLQKEAIELLTTLILVNYDEDMYEHMDKITNVLKKFRKQFKADEEE